MHLTQRISSSRIINGEYISIRMQRYTVYLYLETALRDWKLFLNPLNAELNSIYHLLVLLGNLTFMCPCIVNIFQ
jgi:hypothetical protein